MALDESISGAGTERWCVGLPLVGRRALGERERSVLQSKARKGLRRARALKWLTTAAAAIAGLGVGVLTFGGNARDLREGVSLAFAGIAIALFVCGALGAIGEVVFGRTFVGRIFFFIAGAVSLIGGPWRFVTVPFILAAGTVALIAVTFLGNAMIILRWREGLREYRLFRMALEDLARGEVLIFSADASQPGYGDESKGYGGTKQDPKDIEILPSSNLAVRVDGNRVDAWHVLPIILVAKVPRSPLEAPFASHAVMSPVVDQTLNQRHLTSQEIAELIQFRKTLLRRLPLVTAGIVYFVAVITRGLENLSSGRQKPELSLAGWVVAGLVAAGYAVKQAMVLRRLRADARAARAVVLRRSDTVRAPVSEILPESGLHWTENGLPARWRTRR